MVPTIAIDAASSLFWNTGVAMARIPCTTWEFTATRWRCNRASSRRSRADDPAPGITDGPNAPNAANTFPCADDGGSRVPVRTTILTTRSVLSSTRTTTGDSPSQTERTTVSFTLATSRSMWGPATLMMRRPASALAASSTILGPSV